MKFFPVFLITLLTSFVLSNDAKALSLAQPIVQSESLQVNAFVNLNELSVGIKTDVNLPFSTITLSMVVSTDEVVVTIDDKGKPHRGRIQIQGPDMNPEISWAWAQDAPPTKADGLRELDKLYDSLTDKQKKARKDAYAKVRTWIRNCPEAEADAQISQTWGNKDDSKKRIDIEVIKGKAFTGKDSEADDDSAIHIEGF